MFAHGVHALPGPCTGYLGCQTSLAKHPQGPAGSYELSPQIRTLEGGTILHHWYKACRRVFKGCLGLGCVCRLVPVHVSEAPHDAGRAVMEGCDEGRKKRGLYWFSCPRLSIQGRSVVTQTLKVAPVRMHGNDGVINSVSVNSPNTPREGRGRYFIHR